MVGWWGVLLSRRVFCVEAADEWGILKRRNHEVVEMELFDPHAHLLGSVGVYWRKGGGFYGILSI